MGAAVTFETVVPIYRTTRYQTVVPIYRMTRYQTLTVEAAGSYCTVVHIRPTSANKFSTWMQQVRTKRPYYLPEYSNLNKYGTIGAVTFGHRFSKRSNCLLNTMEIIILKVVTSVSSAITQAGFSPRALHVGFVVDKVEWVRFLSKYVSSPVSYHSTNGPHSSVNGSVRCHDSIRI